MGTLALAIGAGPPGRLNVGVLAEAFGTPFAVGIMASLSAIAIAAIAAIATTIPRMCEEAVRTKAR